MASEMDLALRCAHEQVANHTRGPFACSRGFFQVMICRGGEKQVAASPIFIQKANRAFECGSRRIRASGIHQQAIT